ncbi:MAG: ATP-binding protein [Thermoleophilia bacterium]|nr:ATP-binding protein [Thermoleophilia bacterium]
MFFRLLSRRYEKASIIITSNKSFSDCGEIFGDQVMATTILDRLLHHFTVISIKGDGYRLREKKKTGMLERQRTRKEETDTEKDEKKKKNR